MLTITQLCKRLEKTLNPAKLKSEISPEAVEHNTAISQKTYNNLQSVFNKMLVQNLLIVHNFGTSMS